MGGSKWFAFTGFYLPWSLTGNVDVGSEWLVFLRVNFVAWKYKLLDAMQLGLQSANSTVWFIWMVCINKIVEGSSNFVERLKWDDRIPVHYIECSIFHYRLFPREAIYKWPDLMMIKLGKNCVESSQAHFSSGIYLFSPFSVSSACVVHGVI